MEKNQPLSLNALDDESVSGTFSVRLSAIHALMAISEPMGYADIYTPRLDGEDRGYHGVNGLDSQYSFNQNGQSNNSNQNNDRMYNDLLDNGRHGNNSNSDQQYLDADNRMHNQNNQNNQLYQKNIPDSFVYCKVVESSFNRKCLFEGCDEKVLHTLEEHSLMKDEDEDRACRQSIYCKKHLLGSRKCEYDGCDKCAQGSTKFCIKHGGKTAIALTIS